MNRSAIASTVQRVRRPAVAGFLYPAQKDPLAAQIQELCGEGGNEIARSILLPHGPLGQTGRPIGALMRRVAIPNKCIVLGESFARSHIRWSVIASGALRTPLGDTQVACDLAEELRNLSPLFEVDPWMQKGEHAVEVHLPILQKLASADLSVLPLIMNSNRPLEWREAASALATLLNKSDESILLIASTNLAQFGTKEEVLAGDEEALAWVQQHDIETLSELAKLRTARIAGVSILAVFSLVNQMIGADRFEVVNHCTSADWGGDPFSATGYASVKVS